LEKQRLFTKAFPDISISDKVETRKASDSSQKAHFSSLYLGSKIFIYGPQLMRRQIVQHLQELEEMKAAYSQHLVRMQKVEEQKNALRLKPKDIEFPGLGLSYYFKNQIYCREQLEEDQKLGSVSRLRYLLMKENDSIQLDSSVEIVYLTSSICNF
uniref:PH domain-containing protein n=1 Tax=Soboliphyme baturini TaxID=241478 RepID=A0A183IXV6_9BILA